MRVSTRGAKTFTAAELTEIRRAFRERIAIAPSLNRARQRTRKPRSVPRRMRVPDYNEADILTTRLVAEVSGISTRMVRRIADAGMVPFFSTLGGHRRFRWADVKRWLNEAGAATP
jgi:excisionase family DNA binding protein